MSTKPPWVTGSEEIPGHYSGVGVADHTPSNPEVQLARARENAIQALTNSISVAIRSTFTSRQQLRDNRTGSRAEREVRALTEMISEVELRDLSSAGRWLDRESCAVWVRVKVPRATIAALRNRELQLEKLAQLRQQHSAATNSKLPLDDRKQALDLAYLLLEEINFGTLEQSQSRAFYQQQLEQAQGVLGVRLRSQAVARRLNRSAEKLLLEAHAAPSKRERIKLEGLAVDQLQRLITDFPYGNRETDWAERAAFRLAALERGRGNGCGARGYYQAVLDQTSFEQWSDRAGTELERTECSSTDRIDSAWRKVFANSSVQLLCVTEIDGKAVSWEAACDQIRHHLNRYDALISGPDPNISVNEIVAATRAAASGASADLFSRSNRTLLVLAKGAMKTRTSSRSPDGTDFQFIGEIQTYVIADSRSEFSDRYRGTGGWNPVSSEMALDVLAIHVAKRWHARYAQQLGAAR